MEIYKDGCFEKVYNGDDFNITLERVKDTIFVHCDVFSFSKSILKKMRTYFKMLRDFLHSKGFDEIATYTLNKKFAKLIDNSFEVAGEIKWDGGKSIEVLVWELS